MCRCRRGQRPVSAACLCRCPSVGGLVPQDLCGMRGFVWVDQVESTLSLFWRLDMLLLTCGLAACEVVCWILRWFTGLCLLQISCVSYAMCSGVDKVHVTHTCSIYIPLTRFCGRRRKGGYIVYCVGIVLLYIFHFIFSIIFYILYYMCMPFSMYISSLYIFIFTHPQKARLWDLSIRPPPP